MKRSLQALARLIAFPQRRDAAGNRELNITDRASHDLTPSLWSALVHFSKQAFESNSHPVQSSKLAAGRDSNAPNFEERPQRFRYKAMSSEEMDLIEVREHVALHSSWSLAEPLPIAADGRRSFMIT